MNKNIKPRGRKGAPPIARSAKAAAKGMNPSVTRNPYGKLPPAAPTGYRGQNAPKAPPQRGQFTGQNAPKSSQEQAQLASRRRLDDNTRYRRGKKNAQGFYETQRGQYAHARSIGAF